MGACGLREGNVEERLGEADFGQRLSRKRALAHRRLRSKSIPLCAEMTKIGRALKIGENYEPTTAKHFNSIAIGVGRAVIPKVVRHGCAEVKYSA